MDEIKMFLSVLGNEDFKVKPKAVNLALAQRLRETRIQRGWTQTTLAEQACVGACTVYGIERGYRTGERVLHNIAAALGVSVQWLLGENECKAA